MRSPDMPLPTARSASSRARTLGSWCLHYGAIWMRNTPQGATTTLKQGDEVSIVPAIAGGR